MKDIAASVKARLLHIAKQSNKSFELILLRYCSERLLFRLGISRYKDLFCLKGGSLIYAWENENTRPTRDIDMLAKSIQNDLASVKEIFQEIANIKYNDDGVTYDIANISTEIIQKEGAYHGIRTNIMAFIGDKTKTKIQVDIGFGDIVIGVSEMNYPTFLEMESPLIYVYSKESVIAEKFEAMIDLGEQNSRMKDFYDIFNLLKAQEYDENMLKKAISETFTQRKTPYIETPSVFSDNFANEKLFNGLHLSEKIILCPSH